MKKLCDDDDEKDEDVFRSFQSWNEEMHKQTFVESVKLEGRNEEVVNSISLLYGKVSSHWMIYFAFNNYQAT